MPRHFIFVIAAFALAAGCRKTAPVETRALPAGRLGKLAASAFDSAGRPVIARVNGYPLVLLDVNRDGLFDTERAIATSVRDARSLWFDGPVLWIAARCGLYRIGESGVAETLPAALGCPVAIQRGLDGLPMVLFAANGGNGASRWARWNEGPRTFTALAGEDPVRGATGPGGLRFAGEELIRDPAAPTDSLSSWRHAELLVEKERLGARWGEGLEARVMDAQAPPDERAEAILLLQRFGPAPKLDLLGKWLEAAQPLPVRAAALYVAGCQAGERVKGWAAAALADPAPLLRRRATDALLRLELAPGDAALIETLYPLLADPDPAVRDGAALGVEKLLGLVRDAADDAELVAALERVASIADGGKLPAASRRLREIAASIAIAAP